MKLWTNQVSRIRHKIMSPNREPKGYGKIETGWSHYITPRMYITILALVGLILGNIKVFLEYYHAAIVLNSVIFVTFFFAIGVAINNNIVVRSAAIFMNHFHLVIQRGHATSAEIELLLLRLKSQGRLVNINDMHGAIRNVEATGSPNFSEESAKLIKSKLGFRVAEARKSVSFMGGLMIMLGLIGTYLGLLETVDTVGTVMKKMSSIGGEAGGDGMSSFISDLAEPLQGMALAFSASLFGISGSVFVSVFNGAAAHAQNDFIENVSRWIDDRIPRGGFNLSSKVKLDALPGQDNLKAWLASFVNLSLQTNRKMAQMVYVFSKHTQTALKQTEMLEHILQEQKQTHHMLKDSQDAIINQVAAHHTKSAEHHDKIDVVLSQLHRDMNDLKQGIQSSTQILPALSASVEQVQQSVSQKADQLSEHMATQDRHVSHMSQILGEFPAVLGQLSSNQLSLNRTLESFPQRMQSAEKAEEGMASIVLQLNMILDEINKNNLASLDDLFQEPKQDNLSNFGQAGE